MLNTSKISQTTYISNFFFNLINQPKVMKHLFISTLLLLTINLGFTQPIPPEEYGQLIKKADSLYRGKQYLASGQVYSLAFKSFGWKGFLNDRYNAACSWALANNPDSAFHHLERIAQKGNYSNYKHIINDPDLLNLHSNAKWVPLTEKIKANKDASELNLNKSLINHLDSLVTEDQKWRNLIVKFNNHQLNTDTVSSANILRSLKLTDSLNYIHVKKIFDVHGFPNLDIVGPTGARNFFLLVQHQDANPVFQEEVLTKMKIEADKGKASLIDYAYLLDRVKVNTNQLQIYGTQMILNLKEDSYEAKPMVEPDKVNERRKTVGLGTIDDYIKSMNTVYFGRLKSNK